MSREKNSTKTKEDILKAAEDQFSKKGLFGTRVDEISRAAGVNKRMIYEYFGCKVDLYKKVLEIAYSKIGRAGQSRLEPNDSFDKAIVKVVDFYFSYLNDNPVYVNLILWENMNKGDYIADVDLPKIEQPMILQLKQIIERDQKEGRIRAEIDADQIIITLLTSTFAYFSNRYTLSKLLSYNLMTKQCIEKKAGDLANMIITYISND